MSTIKRNTYRRPSALGVPGAQIETESESVATFTGMPGKRGSAFKAVDHLVAEGQLDSLTYNKISYAGQTGPRAEISKPLNHLRQDGQLERETESKIKFAIEKCIEKCHSLLN